jgi:surfeit locus 1 family protein
LRVRESLGSSPMRYTRRWIVLTVVVLVAVAAMVELGFWQLRRLHSVREDNSRVHARLAQPTEPLQFVLGPGVDPASAVFRRVSVTGRYDRVSEILLRNRSLNGEPGSHELTPLRMTDGRAVIVDRGWIPLDITAEMEERSRPPVLEPVTVVGVLFPSERKSVLAPSIPATGRVTTIPRVDVARIAKQLDYPVAPLYMRLESQTPAQTGELPAPPGPPDLSEGPHLSYAVQWFLFASVAFLTYVALLRRERKKVGARSHTF